MTICMMLIFHYFFAFHEEEWWNNFYDVIIDYIFRALFNSFYVHDFEVM